MVRVCEGLGVSERRACRVLGQARSTQRQEPVRREDEDPLTRAILRHGILAVAVLPSESRQEYEALVTGLSDSQQPIGAFEQLLVVNG